MTDERIAEQNSDEVVEKRSFLSWVKEHKTQLLLAGISVTTILAAAIGLKKQGCNCRIMEHTQKRD